MGNLSTIHPALPDASTLVANAATLILFGSIVVAGIMKGLKEAKELFPRSTTPPTLPTNIPEAARVEAATILENITLDNWSASNRELRVVIERLIGVLASHTDEMAELRRTGEDIVHLMKRGQP